MACSAGKIFLYARSPVAPKKTRASEWESIIAGILFERSFAGCFLHVAAEAEAHRGKQFVLIVRLPARGEALKESGGENGHGNGFVHRGLDGPSAFARIRNPPRELG